MADRVAKEALIGEGPRNRIRSRGVVRGERVSRVAVLHEDHPRCVSASLAIVKHRRGVRDDMAMNLENAIEIVNRCLAHGHDVV